MLLASEQRVWLEVTLTLARAVPTLLQPQVFGKGDLSWDALRADWHLQGPVLSILPCPSSAKEDPAGAEHPDKELRQPPASKGASRESLAALTARFPSERE